MNSNLYLAEIKYIGEAGSFYRLVTAENEKNAKAKITKTFETDEIKVIVFIHDTIV